MPANANDPTEAMRLKASLYPDVDTGTACTQTSFKAKSKAFLFIGQQGGRFKTMFKLKASFAAAQALAEKYPDDFQAGNPPWVTARFSADSPLPRTQWEKWLDESYALSVGTE